MENIFHSTSWLRAQGDRRSHQRYPVTLELVYRLLAQNKAQPRQRGQTLNISSGGVLFKPEIPDALPVGASVELALSWPFLLDGVRPLNLVMVGSVVRGDGTGVAVQVIRHEFRTAPAPFVMKNAST